jgi:PPM family protein phosphatase
MLDVDAAGLTDPGPHRETNEDAIGAFAPAGDSRKGFLYVVADGLGGHNAGEVASATAVQTLGHEYYSPSSHHRIEPALRQAVQAANLRVHNLAHKHEQYATMETTLTAVALAGAHAYIAHIGDCRVYHWREARLTQLTADHSEAAELVRMRLLKPERVRDHPGRNVLTRTLGSRLIPRPDYLRQPIEPGDRFVLCTDGAWSELEEDELSQVLEGSNPQAACRELMDRVLARDCLDNASLQVIEVRQVEAEPQGGPRNGWLSGIFQRGGGRT